MKSIFRLPFKRMTSLSSLSMRPTMLTMQCYRNFSSSLFSEDHQWILCDNNNEALVGITEYAQNSLGEIVYVELPDIGDTYNKGDVFGQIESVKAASELYMPVAGEVVEVKNTIYILYVGIYKNKIMRNDVVEGK